MPVAVASSDSGSVVGSLVRFGVALQHDEVGFGAGAFSCLASIDFTQQHCVRHCSAEVQPH